MHPSMVFTRRATRTAITLTLYYYCVVAVQLLLSQKGTTMFALVSAATLECQIVGRL
jgi:hypothetical protein